MARGNDQEARLLKMLNSSANRNSCGECKTHNPTWASWNLGIFLCGRCASAHRSLGKEISDVKSVSMDHWTAKQLSTIERIGNKRNNEFWNDKRIPFPFDPEDKDVLVTWLRNKYTGKYRSGAVRSDDYNLGSSRNDSTDDYGFDYGSKSSRSYGSGTIYDDIDSSSSGMTRSMRKAHERLNGSDRLYDSSLNGSRSKYSNENDNDYDDYEDNRTSRPSISRNSSTSGGSQMLTFCKPTSSDSKRYSALSRKMKFDMGFEDEDANIEALALTKGSIEQAILIIKRSGSRPSKSYGASVPSLPKRRETAGSLFDSSKAGGFDWLGDGPESSTAGSNAPTDSLIDLDSDQQIFQYVDPNTGTVYYIDSNGQQYADPNGGQQQMMTPMQMQEAQTQMMQLNPSLMQQQQQQQQLYQQQLQQQQLYQQQQMTAAQMQQNQNQNQIYQQAPPSREPTLAELQQQQQMYMQQQMQTGMYPQQQQGYFQGF